MSEFWVRVCVCLGVFVLSLTRWHKFLYLCYVCLIDDDDGGGSGGIIVLL